MKKKLKKHSIYLFFFALLFPCFSNDAKNSVNLIEKSSVLGFSLYWDTFSSSGIIEKDGHQITFQDKNPVVMFDAN